jgi:outer membrane protein OmpA-like peptidoglycan-associated protein
MAATRTFDRTRASAGRGADALARPRERQLESEACRAARSEAPVSLGSHAGPRAVQAPAAGLGRPLPPGLRAGLEPRLGVDLSALRVHSDEAAAQQADEAGARAYAQGRELVFGRGQWRPDEPEGRALAMHEVAHAAQQAQPGATPGVQREPAPAQGPGAAPPTEDFVAMPAGESGVEDGHVLFSRDEIALDPGDREALDALAAGAGPGVAVHVHGYASAEGDTDYNLNLSAHRAVAVKQYLQGVLPAETRITAYAYGESTAFGGRPQNRRVGVDLIEAGGLFNPGLGARFAGSLLPPLSLSLGDDTPPPAPQLPTGLLPPSLRGLPGVGSGLPPYAATPPVWLTTPLPPRSQFDVGSVAPTFALRGVPYTARDAESLQLHYRFWFDNFTNWGMDPGMASTLVQLGTEFAASTDLSLQAPTQQEILDRQQNTTPHTVPVLNGTMMRWLFNHFSRDR